jgi:hypothetical protein
MAVLLAIAAKQQIISAVSLRLYRANKMDAQWNWFY